MTRARWRVFFSFSYLAVAFIHGHSASQMPVSAKLGVTVGMSMTEKQVSRLHFILPDRLTRLPGRIRRARKHDSCSAGRPSQNWEWRRVLVDRSQVVYIRPNERRVFDTEQYSGRQGSISSHFMRAARVFALKLC
jgi:hypothetical protein